MKPHLKTGVRCLCEVSFALSWQQGANMSKTILGFIKNTSGATAIEYGLIAAGISVAIIATVSALGTQLQNTFKTVTNTLGNAGH
jgi:pilus assembly protein Flp/PilA